MKKTFKYVALKNRTVVTFSGSVEHRSFSALEPVSAGFVTQWFDGEWKYSCFGESISLGLKSRWDVDERLFRISGRDIKHV